MNENPTTAERRALELLRQHDPASSLRPGAAARVEARLHTAAKKPRYVAVMVLAAIAISTFAMLWVLSATLTVCRDEPKRRLRPFKRITPVIPDLALPIS